MESRPIEGFTFADCRPLQQEDAIDFPLRWGNRDAADLIGKIVRLEIAIRHAQVYAFRGRHHFIDAQDRSMIQDGKPIDTTTYPF